MRWQLEKFFSNIFGFYMVDFASTARRNVIRTKVRAAVDIMFIQISTPE